jgi:hypothetical protein
MHIVVLREYKARLSFCFMSPTPSREDGKFAIGRVWVHFECRMMNTSADKAVWSSKSLKISDNGHAICQLTHKPLSFITGIFNFSYRPINILTPSCDSACWFLHFVCVDFKCNRIEIPDDSHQPRCYGKSILMLLIVIVGHTNTVARVPRFCLLSNTFDPKSGHHSFCRWCPFPQRTTRQLQFSGKINLLYIFSVAWPAIDHRSSQLRCRWTINHRTRP